MNDLTDFIWFYIIVGLLFSVGNITAFFTYERHKKYQGIVILIAVPVSLCVHAIFWPCIMGWYITTKKDPRNER